MAETHPYERACRNTQHSGCTCMYPIDGKWCGKQRHDPVHADQPTEAPSAAAERIKQLPAEWAQGRPARRFRVMMEPMGRAILAEQERDEAEARIETLTAERDDARAALQAVRDLSGRHLERLRAQARAEKAEAEVRRLRAIGPGGHMSEPPICARCQKPKVPYPHDSGWWVCMTPGCWLAPERREDGEVATR